MSIRTFDSPCGPLTACTDSDALCYLGFGTQPAPDFAVLEGSGGPALLDTLETQLNEYFSGARREFDIPLKLYGTTFRQSVWASLMEIPYGHTVTYGQLAAMTGKPLAARAVGGACHNNPVSIVVPCHRVVGAGQGRLRLTGYGGGLDNKALLLELESKH